ncbi:MAG: hypothetical protein FJ211_09885 [Ignavibacteria bacterium]|nr:hypothetical protein [Ignavibacteria bacterium]
MEFELQNAAQHKIADLLWVAQSQQEVNSILRVFGHDAHVVYNMMMAATFDQIDDTPDADMVIQRIVDSI